MQIFQPYIEDWKKWKDEADKKKNQQQIYIKNQNLDPITLKI